MHRRYNPEGVTAYNIVPGLIGTILTMTMVLMTGLAMTRERERGTLENLLATPALPIEVMTGKIVPYILIGLIQVTPDHAARRCCSSTCRCRATSLLLYCVVLVFIAANLTLGITFSSLARNQLQAMQMTFFFFLPSILLSGFMFPFRGMPDWAQWIGDAAAAHPFPALVRGIMLKGNDFARAVCRRSGRSSLFMLVVIAIGLRFYKRTLDWKPVIAIHGGAGVMRRDKPGEPQRAVLAEALRAGYAILKRGGTSLDAVSAAVVVLEDSPLFNAGRGSCFNAEGEIEMDASVMEGERLRAGAVAAVRTIRNPVLAARMVMEKTRHVLLAGNGAERLAEKHGLEPEPPEYFRTERQQLASKRNLKNYHGTVGAVALDRGRQPRRRDLDRRLYRQAAGRIGDSPLIGAGTYADNRACAVSGTGLGEAFIRAAVAYDVAARMRYRGASLAAAAAAALASVKRLGGDGGLIAVDRRGNVAMPFNSQGMYRGSIDRRGKTTIAVF